MTRPKTGLVLGSGSARGIAHLGVLQVFQEEGLVIDQVVGCSAGAVFGALYAAGTDLYMVEKLLNTYPLRKQVADLVVPPKTGFVKGEKALELLRLLTKDLSFEELPIRLAVVATDLEQGRQVVFTSGKVAPAVRASISIPGVFCPFFYKGMTLVDGAVIERFPVGVAKRLGGEFIIGVDVKSSREAKIRNVFEVMIQSIEIMEDEIFRRTAMEVDVMIQPDVSHIGAFKFELGTEAVRIGREAAYNRLPALKRALKF